MGRPKVPKAKLRDILIQARLSPEENRLINAAIARSKEAKSEWVRNALILAANGTNFAHNGIGRGEDRTRNPGV